jgi:phage gpG-like protein
MNEITIKVDSTAVEARLTRMGPFIRARVADAITREAIQLQRLTKEKLSGPVLKNRTGQLRRSINVASHDTETAVVRTVGTNVRYARAHELGFDGAVNVRQHLRHISQAFGKPIAPMDVLVHAHTAHMHLPERSFLRSSLAERAPSIREALIAAVRESVQ